MVTTKAAPSRPGPAASCWACTAPRTSLQPLTGSGNQANTIGTSANPNSSPGQPIEVLPPGTAGDEQIPKMPTPLPLPPGTTRKQLLARFHVRGGDGRLLSGAQAFLALWAALPGWRWLALVGRLPGASWAMERLYRFFLRWRPELQRWASRLDRAA